jgi:hypothetical protein
MISTKSCFPDISAIDETEEQSDLRLIPSLHRDEAYQTCFRLNPHIEHHTFSPLIFPLPFTGLRYIAPIIYALPILIDIGLAPEVTVRGPLL